MENRPAPPLIATAFFGWAILSGAPTGAGELTTAGLRDDGWRLVDTRNRQEKLPGIAPYESLVRVVQITTHVLEKDGKTMRCEMAYDSQLDRITETCRPGKAAP